MKISFVKSNQKRKILSALNEEFGISDLPYLFLESGKEKLRAFSGSFSKEDISDLGKITRIETIGLYFLKQETPIRLSFDAPHLLASQITKNIVEINETQLDLWLHGQDLQVKKPRGTYIISFKGDFVGLAKSNTSVLLNHVPKDRRLKN